MDKYQQLKDVIYKSEFVLVHLNTSATDLVIPEHLTKEATVTLKLSQYFNGNLELRQERIVADLLFNHEYFTCIIPLSAVWGCTNDENSNLIWPDCTPESILKNLMVQSEQGPKQTSSKTMNIKPAKAAGAAAKSGNKAKGSHLKRVK